MSGKSLLLILALALSGVSLTLWSKQARAQMPEAIYLILDASGSMLGQLPDRSRKIEVAKQVLQEFGARDFSGYELALRVYGHRRKEDCADSELLVPFGPPARAVAQMRRAVPQIKALGHTPITYSLREALKDFGERRGEIILISDGIESCDADPCALVREWRKRNVKIRVHVVGFGLDEKAKETLRCISQAAGTEYHDAGSAAALANELARIHQQSGAAGFWLRGVDEAGKRTLVHGTLARNGQPRYQVSSSRSYRVEAGQYLLTAGVQTRNGNLYQPVSKTVQVAETGHTIVEVQVPTPPAVRAKFVEQGRAHPGALIHAYQNGKEVFSFRANDEVYLDIGHYEFRARPNTDNDLSVTESFAAGDRKEIVFDLARTVHVTFKLIAEGSGTWFRQNYELWQDGVKQYPVHVLNGARVRPGTYELRLPDALFSFAKPGVVVTEQTKQHFEFTVPVGHVTVIYQTADGSRDKDDRCFMSTVPGNQRVFKNGGQQYPLRPGRYRVAGWDQKGAYDPVTFEIKEGADKTVVLRAKR